jgi:hypothetical protein
MDKEGSRVVKNRVTRVSEDQHSRNLDCMAKSGQAMLNKYRGGFKAPSEFQVDNGKKNYPLF